MEFAELARRPGDTDVSDQIQRQYLTSSSSGDVITSHGLIGHFGGDESPLGKQIGWNVPPRVVFEDPARALEELTAQP